MVWYTVYTENDTFTLIPKQTPLRALINDYFAINMQNWLHKIKSAVRWFDDSALEKRAAFSRFLAIGLTLIS